MPASDHDRLHATLGQVHRAVEAATPRIGAAGALAPAAEARIALARRPEREYVEVVMVRSVPPRRASSTGYSTTVK